MTGIIEKPVAFFNLVFSSVNFGMLELRVSVFIPCLTCSAACVIKRLALFLIEPTLKFDGLRQYIFPTVQSLPSGDYNRKLI